MSEGECTSCAVWMHRYGELRGCVQSLRIRTQQQVDDPKRITQGFIFEVLERLDDALAGR